MEVSNLNVSQINDPTNIDLITQSALFQNKYLQPTSFLTRRKYSQDDGTNKNAKRPWT